MAFSFEASKVSWRWHVLWNMTDKWVGVICKCGMVSRERVVQCFYDEW